MFKSRIILIVLTGALLVAGGWGWLMRDRSDFETTIRGNKNLIRVLEPKPLTKITSPLVIKGEARGKWFFEASFLTYLLDEYGNEWMIGLAEAKSNWMTEQFVPFEAIIDWANPPLNIIGERKDPSVLKGRPGTLVLEKSNPSGLSEHDDQLRIPIFFGP